MSDQTSLGFTYPEATDNANLWEHLQELAENINDYLASHGRIQTTTELADSSSFTTTETVIASVTAALVTGRTYRVRYVGKVGTSVGGDTVNLLMKDTNLAGAEIMSRPNEPLPTNTAGGHYFEMETEWTAVATANKTFVVTAVRASGSGSVRREAAATRPTLLYVEYVRG